jgi:YrbI family 3-deoxy-D-manno-octulosonate 8-phosphate phosphatase
VTSGGARMPVVAAIIPARGGSKGVPGKNVATIGGIPLVARAVRAARLAGVEHVYVSTDDAAIADATRAAEGDVIERPSEIAGDTASSEAALLHGLDELESRGTLPDVLVFIQATSPFIDPVALAAAIERVGSGAEDVVFSAFETYAFLWRKGDDGADGVNHDKSSRPRRQDREPHFQETGAFYVMRVAGFREAGHRFFGRVGIQDVSEASAIEIDTPDELAIARHLAGFVDPARENSIDVDALVMDFDGVHTDDRVLVSSEGGESVFASRADGLGIGMLREAGLPMLILSKERNPVVAARGAKLGVEVRQGVDDKLPALQAWAAEHGLDLSRVAYVGNDINDAACLREVGWPIVVPDAHPAIMSSARIVLTRPGGRGALRELADRILASRKEHL